jgi:hypothetical protein
MDLGKKKAMLDLLDTLDDHLDSEDGEALKGLSPDGEEESMEPDGDEAAPAALVVEVGAPKDGPPQPAPPGGESGGAGDAMSVIQAALKSADPAVKAAAEAFMKSKGG